MLPNSVLMIMNAREIKECMLSLKALRGVDKLWFRGYTENQLEPLLHKFIEQTDYQYYLLVSDDVIATQQALDNVLKYQSYGIVTGWCNMSPTLPKGNIEIEPIDDNKDNYFRLRNHTPAVLQIPIKRLVTKVWPFTRIWNWLVYNHFPDIDEVWKQEEIFQTYFIGWALTSMPRQIWKQYPFHFPSGIEKSRGSDSIMSINLHNSGIPMFCARDSFIYHLATRRNMIIGKEEPRLIYEKYQEDKDSGNGEPKLVIQKDFTL